MADRRYSPSAEDIHRDIETTRTEMHETVEALERKLSVGQLVDEVWDRIRGGSTGAVGASVGHTIRDHPVPLALMGLGVAWLAVDRATESEDDRRRGPHRASVGVGTRAPAEGHVGPYRRDDPAADEPSMMQTAKEKAGSFVHKAKEKASDTAESVKEKASGAAESARSTASDAKDSVRSSTSEGARRWQSRSDRTGRQLRERAAEGAARAREEAGYRARQAKRGVRSAVDEQPLAMGALAFGLGLASGLAVPGTRWEDEAMGGTADAVKDETKAVAKDVGESAGQVAKDTARAAREESEREDTVGKVKEAARSVGEKAKETAKRRAREEDLDAQGMKDRAKRAKDRARDRRND